MSKKSRRPWTKLPWRRPQPNGHPRDGNASKCLPFRNGNWPPHTAHPHRRGLGWKNWPVHGVGKKKPAPWRAPPVAGGDLEFTVPKGKVTKISRPANKKSPEGLKNPSQLPRGALRPAPGAPKNGPQTPPRPKVPTRPRGFLALNTPKWPGAWGPGGRFPGKQNLATGLGIPPRLPKFLEGDVGKKAGFPKDENHTNR